MTAWPDFLSPADLAPGEKSAPRPFWSGLSLHVVETSDDPWFNVGFELLATEFSARGQVELREVLERRLAWDPRRPTYGPALLYRMMLLLHATDCVAVRDHTAILHPDASEMVVHLSHSLVTPAWRRQGLSTLLRALPLQTARECAGATGTSAASVTLVAEMEPRENPPVPAAIRLAAYEKGGFLKIDPRLRYRQPDFRSPAMIDASGGPHFVPLDLVVRRVGREAEQRMAAGDVRHLVQSLYGMYAVESRSQDMRPCFDWANTVGTSAAEYYALVRPTASG